MSVAYKVTVYTHKLTCRLLTARDLTLGGLSQRLHSPQPELPRA